MGPSGTMFVKTLPKNPPKNFFIFIDFPKNFFVGWNFSIIFTLVPFRFNHGPFLTRRGCNRDIKKSLYTSYWHHIRETKISTIELVAAARNSCSIIIYVMMFIKELIFKKIKNRWTTSLKRSVWETITIQICINAVAKDMLSQSRVDSRYKNFS